MGVCAFVAKWRQGILLLKTANFNLDYVHVTTAYIQALPALYNDLKITVNDMPDHAFDHDFLTDIFCQTISFASLFGNDKAANMKSAQKQPGCDECPRTANGGRQHECSSCKKLGHCFHRCFSNRDQPNHTTREYAASSKPNPPPKPVVNAKAHLAHVEAGGADNGDEGQLDEVNGLEDKEDPNSDTVENFTENDNMDSQYVSCVRIFHLFPLSMPFTALSKVGPKLDPILFEAWQVAFQAALDSACTYHIVRNKRLFWTYDESGAVDIQTANCGVLAAHTKGIVKLKVKCGQKEVEMVLHDCLHAPDVPMNLLSVNALTEDDMGVFFTRGKAFIYMPRDEPETKELFIVAQTREHLSLLKCTFIPPPVLVDKLGDGTFKAMLASTFTPAKLDLWKWHECLGHLGFEVMKVLKKNYVTGIDWNGTVGDTKCVPCTIGKAAHAPYNNPGNQASQLLELMHTDISGPFPVEMRGGHKYFLLLLDDHSSWNTVILLKAKSQSYEHITEYQARHEHETGMKMGRFRVDGAKELIEGRLGQHLREMGGDSQTDCSLHASTKRKSQRWIRIIQDDAANMMNASGLPPSFRGHAFLTASYIWQHVPTSTLPDNVTPYEIIKGKKPDVSHLRTFGCQCFAIIPAEKRTKGEMRRFEAIFVGYEEDRIGWGVVDLNGKYHFTNDVIFNETIPGQLSSKFRAKDSDALPKTLPTPSGP